MTLINLGFQRNFRNQLILCAQRPFEVKISCSYGRRHRCGQVMQRMCFQSSVVSLPFPLLQEVLNMLKAKWQAF